MIVARTLAKSAMCTAVIAVGCVQENYGEEARAEAQEWKYHGPLAFSDRDPGGGGGGGNGEGATVIGTEILDVTIPKSLHAQDLDVPAKLVRPKWSKPVGERPAVMVLHGSGGLLKTKKKQGDPGPCSSDMESQFSEWSERLAKLGYTVLLPSSYSARGFCDKHSQTPPPDFDANSEQILGRIYDLDAAARYLCDRPEVDCDRMGLLGFSQGGTMTMIGLHWQIEHALAYFRDTKADTVDIEIPDVKPGRPDFVMGVAYYPGCGFDGAVPLSTSNSAKDENKFLATAPLTILHGSDDPLVEHCSTEYGAGSRQTQSAQVSGNLKVADPYDITVYPDAGHSFDNGPAAADGGTDAGNDAAREAALAVTLEQLALHLGA